MKESSYIKKIRNGDQNALNSFIEELYPQLYQYVYRKLNGSDNSADITQETFIRFIRVIPTYHAQGKVLPYLYKIASNVCNDYFKRMGKENYLEFKDDLVEDCNENVHENILKQIDDENLMEMLQRLHPLQQDVMLFKYYHQLTFKEIANMYGIPESTVKSRHTQALKKLRMMVKEGESYAGR